VTNGIHLAGSEGTPQGGAIDNERGSLIITSNRAFDEWAEVFNNDLLASAALDRLTTTHIP